MNKRWLLTVVVFNLFSQFFVTTCVFLYKSNTFGSEMEYELEAIKRQFLEGLGLSRIPDVTRVNTSVEEMETMLSAYHQKLFENQNNEYYLSYKTYEVTAQPSDSPARKVFTLVLPNSTDVSIHSATLHLYKYPNATGEVSLRQLTPTKQLLVNRHITNINPTWEAFDLHQWLIQPPSNHRLSVQFECEQCKGDFFSNEAKLQLTIKSQRRRVKRHTGKRKNNPRRRCKRKECCRRPLTVNFQEIGWDWIKLPPSFQAHYCRGKCNKFNLSQHAIIKSLMREKRKKLSRICCVPRKLRSLDILHYNDEDPPRLVVQELKGMIVASCGCM